MSGTREIGSLRRRPMPGMASQAIVATPEPAAANPEPEPTELGGVVRQRVSSPQAAPATVGRTRDRNVSIQRRSLDYSATRLVNFRLPVDLHDRFRALVREAEERHPRLRKASLTEVVIALLEEAPQTADDVAELIRRKRLAEHEEA